MRIQRSEDVRAVNPLKGTAARRSKASLLASTCFAATGLVLATGAFANDITVTGGVVNTPVPGSTLWALPIGGTTTATVDTAPLDATPFGLNAIWIAQLGLAGTDIVNMQFPVTGVTGVLVTSTNDTVNITNGVSVTGSLVDGVFVANALGGTVTVNGPGTFDGLRNGIWVTTPGDTNIGTVGGPIGAVTGGVNGVVITESVGNTVANLTSAKGPLGYGVWTLSTTGNQTITATGETSGTTGQFLNSGTGNISTDGKGTGTLNGTALDGALVTTLGDVTVNNYATVTGLRNGIYVNGTAGTTSIQGNGLVGGITATTLNGIVVGPSSGDVHIGDTATNGEITALANGIWINNTFAGNNTIVQNHDVTGGDAFSGIVTGTATGATSITATADTKGGLGIWAVAATGDIIADGKGTGTLTGTVLDGAQVTTLGNATVQNFATVDGLRNGIYVLGTGAGTTTEILR